jgi:hypothetical protein
MLIFFEIYLKFRIMAVLKNINNEVIIANVFIFNKLIISNLIED